MYPLCEIVFSENLPRLSFLLNRYNACLRIDDKLLASLDQPRDVAILEPVAHRQIGERRSLRKDSIRAVKKDRLWAYAA